MRKVGLKYPGFALLSEITGSPVYSSGFIAGGAISAGIDWMTADGKIHSNDAISDEDNSIIGGKEILAVDELPLDAHALLLGHTYANNEMIISENDEPPYVGHGFYGKVKTKSGKKYLAVFIPKIKYSEPQDNYKTRGERIEYTTPEITGNITFDVNGKIKYTKLCDTETEAKDYVNGKLNIVPRLEKPVASKASGSYTGVQSITLTALTGADIYYTLNGTTPSATNGTKYSAAISVPTSCALRAIAIKAGMGNSEVASFEYLIS